MFSIKCVDNKIYSACPRCNSEWKISFVDPPIFECKNVNCAMLAVSDIGPSIENKYYLQLNLEAFNKSYSIEWNINYCEITIFNLDSESELPLLCELPNLPFDIAIDKLKTYLVFS